MSYSDKAYWQARANACQQFADEGACLARVSRFAPVTISPGLGQVTTGALTTLYGRSEALTALQLALMESGALNIRTADGLISGDSSPTLLATRSAAQALGMDPSLVRRTATNGIELPAALLSSLMGRGGPGTAKPGASIPPSSVLPETAPASTGRSWVPWVAGGAVSLLVLGVVAARRK